MSDKNDACKIFSENNYAQNCPKRYFPHGMMISIYSEMIPYHFTVDYDFYRTDIFHDFTAKNKII